ncbi:T9SS type A sorting domain-containing protein [Cryomorpha ignava]|uniref:T9SS type A sorting domain-containing protein n=1 Tax=Cryomorpha ignava TaxID=101383 RepID=A0A7K3WYH5_9FLAO|nr:LamG-like jellyroll fold domain-containing protein [Cryomorpha ignava]NEN25725.1 T9SS type A sorting domain-containing protein [Cryomorpha ignava]
MKAFYRVQSNLLICTFSLMAAFATAQSNQYLQFAGVDDYTEFPAAAQYLTGLNTISMTGWFKTDALTYGQGMMSIRGGGTGDGQMYMIQLGNGVIECRVITNSGLHEVVAPAGTVIPGVWQHYAWIFDQNSVELFVDGISVGSSFASGTFQSSDRPFTVGITLQAGFNFIYKGGADEVSLWSKALTQSEVQDIIDNELIGDEADLVTYYKFNQGTPGGDNQSINQLISEVGIGDRNSNLIGFALTGDNSNFLGELESGFQAISFPLIGNKLITQEPFDISAEANSGLPVTFTIVSGPASISGNTISLEGTPGEVTVKASQPGNDIFDAANDVFVTFNVLDPATTLPEVTILHPLAGDVFVPTLRPLQIAVKSTISYPDLFETGDVTVTIGSDEISLTGNENGFYTGWWTPVEYGPQTMMVTALNNFGNAAETEAVINIVATMENVSVNAMDEAHVYIEVQSVTVEADLPSYVGAYDQIIGTLTISCPPGGCDPWDRVSSVEVQGKDGEWYEIIRYLTPYGVACNHTIDLTDFMSLLSGKTAFRVNLTTFANGFEYTLDLDYQAGEPTNPYSQVQKLWYQTYAFGDLANLQPTEEFTLTYPINTAAAKIKLVSTGHGWGVDENADTENTNNAAEFSENTHHIWVDGTETFTQHNWNDCNPNPDGCSPQFGTWQFNRAGWCPGSIAQFFDYDLANVSDGQVTLDYVFDEAYVDYCHPNNPDCVDGVTCDNCDGGFNPHLIVSSYLITRGPSPLGGPVGLNDVENSFNAFNLYPNPSTGRFNIGLDENLDNVDIVVYDQTGRSVKKIQSRFPGRSIEVDLRTVGSGVYVVMINTEKGTGSKILIVI